MLVHPSSAEFEQMFELAPVSLWLEDFSALKTLFEQWRAEGVTDLLAHVAGQPERLQQCTAAIKVQRVEIRGGRIPVFGARASHDATSCQSAGTSPRFSMCGSYRFNIKASSLSG